ncbi:MAG TPA: SH3 domain-containing protein [Verrucomicrobiae bacterium]|nr:SH3 domain-containing protein [Verrucomicrobiae bacterium]
MHARGVFARVIASGVIGLLVATLALPAIWPGSPWASTASAASCNGASHEILLTAPNASPRSGTPATTIRFTVTYRDTAGCAPSSVIAVVPGAGQLALTASGTSYATGVLFQGTMRLPVGTWGYRFDAQSGTGGGTRTASITGPGTIVITLPPSPTPRPTPVPTPRPTPVPTPVPTPKPTSKPTPRPTSGSSSPSASPSKHPTPSPSTGPGGSPGSTSGSGRSPRPSDAPAGGEFGGIGGFDPSGPNDPPGMNPGGPTSDRGFGLPSLGLDPGSTLPIVAWFMTTTFGVVLFAALFQGRGLTVLLPGELSVLVMRRRTVRGGAAGSAAGSSDGAPPDDGAGHPVATVAVAAEPGRPAGTIESPPGRPTGSAERQPRRFAKRPAAGVERRVIAYRSVRVSSAPDDIRSTEITRLDRRDEVEVIGEEAGFLRIRTPDGIEGWVPRVVLVGAPSPDEPASSNGSEPGPDSGSKRRRRGLLGLRRGAQTADATGSPSKG